MLDPVLGQVAAASAVGRAAACPPWELGCLGVGAGCAGCCAAGRAVGVVSDGLGRLRLAVWAATMPTTTGVASATLVAPLVPGWPLLALAPVTSPAAVVDAAVVGVGVVVARGEVALAVTPPPVAGVAASGACRCLLVLPPAALVAGVPASSLRGRCGTCPA